MSSENSKIKDVVFGGIGGAIAASIIAILANVYLESVRNDERASAQVQISDAKQQVVNAILETREKELEQIYKALSVSNLAESQAKRATQKITSALLNLEIQEKKVSGIVGSLEEKLVVNNELIAELIRPKVINALEDVLPTGAVVPFTTECPTGWKEYESAHGRFIRGIDRSGSLIDPSGERAFGDLQEDELKAHKHSYSQFYSVIDGGQPVRWDNNDAGFRGQSTGASGGKETRPKNVSLLYCIKL